MDVCSFCCCCCWCWGVWKDAFATYLAERRVREGLQVVVYGLY